MANAPADGRSVAAMMRRGPSFVEAQLILPPGGGYGRFGEDEPIRR